MNAFTLPSLPYNYNALAPYIDVTTMEIHHSRHHQGYVNKLNAALEQSLIPPPNTLTELCTQIEKYSIDIRNNAGGHYNHTFFWESLSPHTHQPAGILLDKLTEQWGTLDNFYQDFHQKATTLFGSGWTWLCADKKGRLTILNTPNQDNPLMDSKSGQLPILGLDLWEHAYYLSYQNKRSEYIQAFWHIVHWDKIAQRYQDITA